MEIRPKAKQFTKDGIKFYQIYSFKILEMAQRLAQFYQIGEIFPNLVTLVIKVFLFSAVARICLRSTPSSRPTSSSDQITGKPSTGAWKL